MIHSMRIKNGTLQYSNKYTMTDKLKHELEHEGPIDIRFGELEGGISGTLKTGVYKMH